MRTMGLQRSGWPGALFLNRRQDAGHLCGGCVQVCAFRAVFWLRKLAVELGEVRFGVGSILTDFWKTGKVRRLRLARIGRICDRALV